MTQESFDTRVEESNGVYTHKDLVQHAAHSFKGLVFLALPQVTMVPLSPGTWPPHCAPVLYQITSHCRFPVIPSAFQPMSH